MATERPDATHVAAELLARRPLAEQRAELRANCGACGTRLGVVISTSHGPLWIGSLGVNGRRKAFRRRLLRRYDMDATGGNLVPVWLDEWRSSYMCECKCLRNSIPGPALWSAHLARKRHVRIPLAE